MYYPMAMYKRDSFKDITQNLYNFLLFKLLLLPDELEEVITRAILHDEINLLLIVEEAIQFDNVGMAEVHLYFDLSHEGYLQVLFLDDFFGDGFDGADEAGVFVPRDVDLPILARPDLHPQLEFIQLDNSFLFQLMVLLLVVLKLLSEMG
jgi:hypothetical protein